MPSERVVSQDWQGIRDLSSIYTHLWRDQLAFFADQPEKTGSELVNLSKSQLIPPGRSINRAQIPPSLSVLSDWPVMQHMKLCTPGFWPIWLLKMATILLLLGHFAPHDPWSSTDLISYVINGNHFTFTWHFCSISFSKWLPNHVFLLSWLLKMAANPWLLSYFAPHAL